MKKLHLLSLYLLLHLLAAPKPLLAQVVTVYSTNELFAAVAKSGTGGVSKINVSADTLKFRQPLILPASLANKTRFSRLIIDFQGAEIQVMNSMPFVIGRAIPDSMRISDTIVKGPQWVADNIMQSQGFTILNLYIDGRGLAQIGIAQRATYHDYMAWVTVSNCVVEGISERFGMNAYIFQCEVRSCGGNGIELRNGDWPGAALNNSGSNMASVNNCRVFPRQNQTACFASIASGNTGFYGDIVDFAAGQRPQRSFLLDNNGSTTCKQITVDRTWDETDILICHYDVRGNGGTIDILRNYPQKGGTQVLATGGNYTQINIEKWGNMLGRFQATTNNGVVWRFTNNGGSYDPSLASNWVNSRLPISFYVERFIATQEWSFNVPTGRNLKINNKILVDQDFLTKTLSNYQLKP